MGHFYLFKNDHLLHHLICTRRAGKLYKARSRLDRSKQASKYVQSFLEKKRDPGIRAQLKCTCPESTSTVHTILLDDYIDNVRLRFLMLLILCIF